jgi:hypothetical protein
MVQRVGRRFMSPRLRRCESGLKGFGEIQILGLL